MDALHSILHSVYLCSGGIKMSKQDNFIVRVYLHNGETVEAEVIEEELTEIYKMFTEEKEDLFSSDVCIVGDNEIDMNEVEHIAYKRI